MTFENVLKQAANILELTYSHVEQMPYVTIIRLLVEENERLLIENDKLFKTIGVDPLG